MVVKFISCRYPAIQADTSFNTMQCIELCVSLYTKNTKHQFCEWRSLWPLTMQLKNVHKTHISISNAVFCSSCHRWCFRITFITRNFVQRSTPQAGELTLFSDLKIAIQFEDLNWTTNGLALIGTKPCEARLLHFLTKLIAESYYR